MGRIRFDEALPIWRNVGVNKDCVNGTFGFTKTAVNALVWVDEDLVITFINAIDRANGHTRLVFHSDARFGYNVWHSLIIAYFFGAGSRFSALGNRFFSMKESSEWSN